jgi:hypothetical protein
LVSHEAVRRNRQTVLETTDIRLKAADEDVLSVNEERRW